MITSTKELYEKMCATTDLCGRYEVVGETIFWALYDGYSVRICVTPTDTCISIEKKSVGKITTEITHWHPDAEDIYEEVCNIGVKGNVLVIRKSWFSASVLFIGKADNCPYNQKTRWLWGKIYHLKAE